MKGKDPAFLFYSKEFYEGTRMMLPAERACYIDLLCYQHQHGFIPNVLDRVVMYCSGVDLATLQATLAAKFKQCESGWFNEVLKNIVDERREYGKKQAENGKVGAFYKSAIKQLDSNDYDSLKKKLYSFTNKEKVELIERFKLSDPNSNALAMLKHLSIGDSNSISVSNSIKINNGVDSESSQNETFDLTDDEPEAYKPNKANLDIGGKPEKPQRPIAVYAEHWNEYLSILGDGVQFKYEKHFRIFDQAISEYGWEMIKKVIELKSFQCSKGDHERKWLAPTTIFKEEKLEKYVYEVNDIESGRTNPNKSNGKRNAKADALEQAAAELRRLEKMGV